MIAFFVDYKSKIRWSTSSSSDISALTAGPTLVSLGFQVTQDYTTFPKQKKTGIGHFLWSYFCWPLGVYGRSAITSTLERSYPPKLPGWIDLRLIFPCSPIGLETNTNNTFHSSLHSCKLAPASHPQRGMDCNYNVQCH